MWCGGLPKVNGLIKKNDLDWWSSRSKKKKLEKSTK